MQSGDEASKRLKQQLDELTDEFEKFKAKAKNDFDDMQSDLTIKHTRELVNMKEKYETMIAELKANAKNDKEFLKMELEKKIRELQQEIELLKSQFGKDKEALMGE